MNIFKKYIKYFLIFLFIFFLGLFSERFDFDKKIFNFTKYLVDYTSRTFYGFISKEKINIEIKPEHYDKILKVRELSLKKNQLREDIQEWVPAKLIVDNNTYDIRIRLKGTFPDHWNDPTQWSFQIKINNNSKTYLGYRRLNLQPPKTVNYLYEWLLMKAFENEKLISLGATYINLQINGSNRGAYILQGAISEEIIKKNKRQAGPVIGFSKKLYLKEMINSQRLDKLNAVDSLNGIEDTFWRAKIEPVQFSDDLLGTKQEEYLQKAIYLLESFRKGSLKTDQVFDIKQLAKVMALRAALGSSEFDWRDTKFYFNPTTSLLEPISKESHVSLDLNFRDHYFSWWIDSSDIRSHYINNTNFFLDLLYKDENFYREYLSQLNNFSKQKYYKELIEKNTDEFKKFSRLLNQNYPSKQIFSEEHIEITRLRILDFLNPVQGINVYFSEYKENFLTLNISNLQRLPVEILGIEFEDNSKIYLEKPNRINGKTPLLAVKNNLVKIDCKFKEQCKKLFINKQKVIFKIFGQDKEIKEEISQHYFKSK